MAEKSIPTDPETTVETTVKVVEDVMAKAQTQYLTVLSESQNLALDAYKTMVDSVAKLNLPSMPAMPGMSTFAQMPASLVESAFGFSAAVLESQREFAKKIFEVTAS